MKEQDLLRIRIPDAWVKIVVPGAGSLEGTISFSLQKENSSWYLECKMDNDPPRKSVKQRRLLPGEDVADVLDDALSVDQWVQDKAFQGAYREVCEEMAKRMAASDPGIAAAANNIRVDIQPGQYLLQQHTLGGTSKANLLDLLGGMIRRESQKKTVPQYLRVKSPDGFVPDKTLLESVRTALYEQYPAVAILGPTGSGKSATARYVASRLHEHGFGAYIIDAHARLEGDRLLERDDFNATGTFIQEGVLLRLARETQKLGLRLIVILEEYNAFTDETRREFYRLFNDEDRRYPILSGKGGHIKNWVDFSHVQFILTGNPLTSDRYLTDDLKRLSNAEARRMVVLYQDYATDPATLTGIFQAIIHRKETYKMLQAIIPDLDKKINYKFGTDLFVALNARKSGQGLGYDVGYSSMANCIWSLVLREHRQDCYALVLTEHILNAIPTLQARSVAADRIRQAVNIVVPQEMLTRDA